MRKLDKTLSTVLETIERLEFDLSQTLNSDQTHNKNSIEIKNKIDILRQHVCSEVKYSLLNRKQRVA